MAKVTGKILAEIHNLSVVHALYRKSGDWYHIPNKFPAALLDNSGYIKFKTKNEYIIFINNGKNSGIYKTKRTNTLHIPNRILSYAKYYEKFISIYPDEIVDASIHEGAMKIVMVNIYERNSRGRKICIEEHGLNCAVCGMNFKDSYGDIGEGFIHVHHLEPVSSIGREYKLNPKKHLRPVCPNCHSMLHRHNPPLSIDDLKIKYSSLKRK